MRHLIFLVLALASFLPASQPPELGALLDRQLIDPLTVVSYHEHGLDYASLDPETMEVTHTYAVTLGPPAVTTRWTDTQGLVHEVTTDFPTQNPTTAQIHATLQKHIEIVTAMKAVFPPQGPTPRE